MNTKHIIPAALTLLLASLPAYAGLQPPDDFERLGRVRESMYQGGVSFMRSYNVYVKADSGKNVEEVYSIVEDRLSKNAYWRKANTKTNFFSFDIYHNDNVTSQLRELISKNGYTSSRYFDCINKYHKKTKSCITYLDYCVDIDLVPNGSETKSFLERSMTSIATSTPRPVLNASSTNKQSVFANTNPKKVTSLNDYVKIIEINKTYKDIGVANNSVNFFKENSSIEAQIKTVAKIFVKTDDKSRVTNAIVVMLDSIYNDTFKNELFDYDISIQGGIKKINGNAYQYTVELFHDDNFVTNFVKDKGYILRDGYMLKGYASFVNQAKTKTFYIYYLKGLNQKTAKSFQNKKTLSKENRQLLKDFEQEEAMALKFLE